MKRGLQDRSKLNSYQIDIDLALKKLDKKNIKLKNDLTDNHYKYITKCKLEANKEKEQREKSKISKIYAKISTDKDKNCKTSSELIVEDYRFRVKENTKYFNFSVFDGASPTKISVENPKMLESMISPIKFEEEIFSPSKKV